MGVIEQAESVERESPELPVDMLGVYSYYKRLRFGRAIKDDSIMLVARDALTYTEVKAFSDLQHEQIDSWMIETIMNIDAIFESRG